MKAVSDFKYKKQCNLMFHEKQTTTDFELVENYFREIEYQNEKELQDYIDSKKLKHTEG